MPISKVTLPDSTTQELIGTGIRSLNENRIIVANAAPLYRYKICGYNNTGKIVPLVVTNQTSTTIVEKTPTIYGLDPARGLVFYNSETAVTSTASSFGGFYNEYPSVPCQYTFNAMVGARSEVYLKGTMNSTNGQFYLDNSTTSSWYVVVSTALTTANYRAAFVTGAYYMYVGCTGTEEDVLQLKYNNQLLYFNGTLLVPVVLDTRRPQILSGSSEPASSLGNDGDIYIQILYSITNFALNKISVLGNKTMSDEQKIAVSRFFDRIQAESNGAIWQKIDWMFLPIISGTVTGAVTDVKSETKEGASVGSFTLGVDGCLHTAGTAITVRTAYGINPKDFGCLVSFGNSIALGAGYKFYEQNTSPVVDILTGYSPLTLRNAKNNAVYNNITFGEGGSEWMHNSKIEEGVNTQSVFVRNVDNENLVTASTPNFVSSRIDAMVGLSGTVKLGVLSGDPAGIAAVIVGKCFTNDESNTILEAITALKKAFA